MKVLSGIYLAYMLPIQYDDNELVKTNLTNYVFLFGFAYAVRVSTGLIIVTVIGLIWNYKTFQW